MAKIEKEVMSREAIMEHVAHWFNVQLDDDEEDKYDLESYDWSSGCYCGFGERATWMSLGNFVRCMEAYLNDIEYCVEYEDDDD